MTLRDAMRVAQQQIPLPFKAAEVFTVSGLSADPREVIVSDQTGSDRAVPCMASYRGRAVGDVVFAVQLAGGSWLVLGKIGEDDNASATVSYGTGNPSGGGWRSADAVWIRDNGQGSQSLYVDTAGAIPFPAMVPAASAAGWLVDGTATSEYPRSGSADSTSPDWVGVWFYDNLRAAIGAGLVTSMTVKITRTMNGIASSAPLVLGLHNTTPGIAPAITGQWTPGVSLARGGTAIIPIPTAQLSLLGSGAAAGIAVCGTGPQSYAEFTPNADISITFG